MHGRAAAVSGVWTRGAVRALCGLWAALAGGNALAATVVLSASGSMSPTYEFLSPGGAVPVAVGDDYALTIPGQYILANQFLSDQDGLAPLATSAAVGPYTFMDSYRFTIDASAEGSTLVASLGLGDTFDISNLQMRLYRVPTATTAPTLPGLPAGSDVVTGWQGQSGSSTTITNFFTVAQAGTYILDVAGIASGSNGGTYVGQLNLTAVPLPAAGLLLLSALGGLGAFARRRTH